MQEGWSPVRNGDSVRTSWQTNRSGRRHLNGTQADKEVAALLCTILVELYEIEVITNWSGWRNLLAHLNLLCFWNILCIEAKHKIISPFGLHCLGISVQSRRSRSGSNTCRCCPGDLAQLFCPEIWPALKCCNGEIWQWCTTEMEWNIATGKWKQETKDDL